MFNNGFWSCRFQGMNIRRRNRYFRTKSIDHYSFLLTVTSIILSISAQSSNRNWVLGSTGKVKWSTSCDFIGKDYAIKSGIIITKKCEELCVADSRCTHFTSEFSTGTCYLKTSKNSLMKETNVNGLISLTKVCGYVIDRVQLKATQVNGNNPIKWHSVGGNGTYKWGKNCNIPERDIGNISMQESKQCGSACFVHKRCTHFAHYNGKCHLKTVNGSPRKPINKPGGICGFIVERKLTQNWLSSHNGRISLGTDCDFPGYDIEKIVLTSNNKTVCPDKCLANKRCTHFVHSTPFLPHQCILKEIPAKSVVEIVNERAPVCGFLVK